MPAGPDEGKQTERRRILLRNTTPGDFDGIQEIARLVYPNIVPWSREQLASHLEVFPEGQFVAVEERSGLVVGMCSSLIIRWDDYEMNLDWATFTDRGFFTNHDPGGRTLYAADVMVRPGQQGRGVGKRLYRVGRFDLARRLGLCRVRAGSRLRGYHRVAGRMTPEEYVIEVIHGRRRDPTLSFQLKQGFRVIGVVSEYIRGDPESLGYAAVIEWINEEVATPEDLRGGDPRFAV